MGFIGRMEKKMETTIMGYIGIIGYVFVQVLGLVGVERFRVQGL